MILRPRTLALRRACAAAIGTLLLQGCIPARESYLRIEAPAAQHFQSTCRGSVGAPVIVYYPFQGIFISIDLEWAFVGLHIPRGTVAQLNGDAITITGTTKNGPVSKQIHLRLVPQNMVGTNVPDEFRKMDDAFESSLTTLSPLTGASANGYQRWYLFIGSDDLPNRFSGAPYGLLEGAVALPAMTINGQTYPSQVLPFKRQTYDTVLPLNC